MITIARTDRFVRRVDERNDNIITGGGDLIQIGSAAPTMPGVIQPPPPTNVTIGTQVLLRTTYTPKVAVNVSWGAPPNLLPEFYLVEYAENSSFTADTVIRITTSLNRIALEMKPDTDYWVRVKAMIRNMYSEWAYPSNYPTVSVHTIGDTTPPASVTGVTANWATGDLILKWTNPSSLNFFQARVRIYNTFGGTLYKEIYIVGNPGSKSEYRFTVDENNDVTGNNPLTTVYYEILAYSIMGVPAVSAVTGTITKAKPTKPTGLSTTWAGDDGTYDETVTFSWGAVTGATNYRLIIDGVIKETPRTQYTYSYSENVSDHRPTLVSGDYSLAYTVQAKDPLGQISPGASGTATNVAPQASNLDLTVVPGFSSLFAYITPADEILDLYGYNWTLKSGGVNVRQVVSFTPEVSFTTLNGIYTLNVFAVDKFGQKSTTLSGVVTLDGLTIEQLRTETSYTNSLGTSSTVLAGLKDNNLARSVFTVSSGITWQWTKAERPLLDRYRTFTVAFSGAATNMPRVYFSTSTDDTTYTYFSGPLVSTGAIAGNTTLTSYGTEASAQSNAVLATNINRYDLPSITEARYLRMHHRGNTHNVAEWYPRRVVQSDDMEAESIKSINIAANAIIADHINVINLQAISAQMGSLHMDGVIDIAAAGGIYQGTGSFASPTTGLKLYNSSGIGKLSTYSGGTEQIKLDTDGKLKAAAGAVFIDSTGINFDFAINSGYIYLKWYNSTTKVADAGVDNLVGENDYYINVYNSAGTVPDSTIKMVADKATPALSYVAFELDGYNSTSITKTGIVTDTVTAQVNLVADGGYLTGPFSKTAITMTDTYLRLNQDGDFTGGTYTPGFFRVDGGIVSGAISTPGAGNIGFSGNLKPYANSTFYDSYTFVPLTTPLTSTSFDSDSFSTTAKTAIDLSVAFGAPAGIKAILVTVFVRDSGSAATDTLAILSPNNTANQGMAFDSMPVNDRYGRYVAVVPCNATGDIYYQVVASGASTFELWIQIWGYWI